MPSLLRPRFSSKSSNFFQSSSRSFSFFFSLRQTNMEEEEVSGAGTTCSSCTSAPSINKRALHSRVPVLFGDPVEAGEHDGQDDAGVLLDQTHDVLVVPVVQRSLRHLERAQTREPQGKQQQQQQQQQRCGLETHLEICLKSGSWIFTNCVGSMTSRISSSSPRNITWQEENVYYTHTTNNNNNNNNNKQASPLFDCRGTGDGFPVPSLTHGFT
ncbi:hypothetical protein EYF80_030391 [Liparis tanakae]|uniref:Uncharacterized protein n=1 Tax=Liparis tanakae TaxID=230148 RepID=A0A4Z2H0U7_9TELE|nr:hypothetical protein EYF80_030391 [Liparis tanakae]